MGRVHTLLDMGIMLRDGPRISMFSGIGLQYATRPLERLGTNIEAVPREISRHSARLSPQLHPTTATAISSFFRALGTWKGPALGMLEPSALLSHDWPDFLGHEPLPALMIVSVFFAPQAFARAACNGAVSMYYVMLFTH